MKDISASVHNSNSAERSCAFTQNSGRAPMTLDKEENAVRALCNLIGYDRVIKLARKQRHEELVRASPDTVRALARKFGVHRRTVQRARAEQRTPHNDKLTR